MNHFQAGCRRIGGRGGTVHGIEENTMTEKQVDIVNIKSFSFNSIC